MRNAAKKLALLLAAAALLAGCAGRGRNAAPPTAMPAPVPSAAPTATPAPPTPEPTAAPIPITYTTMPVRMEPNPLPSYEGATYTFMPDNETARRNGYEFVAALYTHDVERLETALSDEVLAAGNPLRDLNGLVIGEVHLAGGRYEVPVATLTVIDPGNTRLPVGQHEYRWQFDEEGKVAKFSPYLVAAIGEQYPYGEKKAGLSPQEWTPIESLNQWLDEEGIRQNNYVLYARCDPLCIRAEGEGRLFCYELQRDTQTGETETTSVREIPGSWQTPQFSSSWMRTPPAGNDLPEEELAALTGQLNTRFAELQAGTYRPDFADAYDPRYHYDFNLQVWDAAMPLPVSVTPEVLRSEQTQYNPEIYTVWVPLPTGTGPAPPTTGQTRLGSRVGSFTAWICLPPSPRRNLPIGRYKNARRLPSARKAAGNSVCYQCEFRRDRRGEHGSPVNVCGARKSPGASRTPPLRIILAVAAGVIADDLNSRPPHHANSLCRTLRRAVGSGALPWRSSSMCSVTYCKIAVRRTIPIKTLRSSTTGTKF